MRELSVQAANDTLTKEDRQLVQNEIDQLKQSIDNIAKNTNFNGIHLLLPKIQILMESTC
jgi:flagellin